MRLKTDMERYLFARAAYRNAEAQMNLIVTIRSQVRTTRAFEYETERYFMYMKRCNFWGRVARYFKDRAMNGSENSTEFKLIHTII